VVGNIDVAQRAALVVALAEKVEGDDSVGTEKVEYLKHVRRPVAIPGNKPCLKEDEANAFQQTPRPFQRPKFPALHTS